MKTNDDFDKLVPRVRGKEISHPESTAAFAESKKDFRTLTEPTEDTPLVVYAWEFLRRNRFYQAIVDKRKDALPTSQWGFKSHPLEPNTHGLTKLKPYWEDYDQREPPKWIGLDSFAERTMVSICDEPQEVTLKLMPGQVAVVFDTYGVLNGRSPIEIQTNAVSFYLSQLAERQYQIKTLKNKSIHQSVLLRRWKLMKLLFDDGITLSKAADKLGYPKKDQAGAGKLEGFGSRFQQVQKKEPVTTAFEDANFIYSSIYRHGYIDLLARKSGYIIEDGRLVPSKFSATLQDMIEHAMHEN